ncbi:MAG: hypothetical protein KatS3mg059_1526 [Thermomicrobiales bacterium]|nr:MAG: hypothetical protein KatS3mg059_1526 [Thermomicrobiales bacterium]
MDRLVTPRKCLLLSDNAMFDWGKTPFQRLTGRSPLPIVVITSLAMKSLASSIATR